MQIIYLIFILIYAVVAVFCYRLGVKDGEKRCNTGTDESVPYKNKGITKKAIIEKELSPEDKKIKEGIANIMSYGIGGEK